MVKIQYAGIVTDPIQRFSGWDRNQIACTIITEALDATNVKFDNNIVFNRFDAVGSRYEVTIKCISSRGKGAKRGTSGRRTTSACWHAWGTFFDELFRLNPRIVVIAQGNRITATNGNWFDRDVGNGVLETELCDCEASQAIQNTEREVDDMIAATAQAESNARFDASCQPTHHKCDDTCRHSRGNNLGVPCTKLCVGSGNPGWEPVRTCNNCEHKDIRGAGCHDVVGLCSVFSKWKPYTPPTTVERTCENCKYSARHNNGRMCHTVIGSCLGGNPKWELYVDPNTITTVGTSRYDTQMVEQDGQIELLVEFPMLKEE